MNTHDPELSSRIIMQISLCKKNNNTRVIKSENLRVPNQCRNPLSDIFERH